MNSTVNIGENEAKNPQKCIARETPTKAKSDRKPRRHMNKLGHGKMHNCDYTRLSQTVHKNKYDEQDLGFETKYD